MSVCQAYAGEPGASTVTKEVDEDAEKPEERGRISESAELGAEV